MDSIIQELLNLSAKIQSLSLAETAQGLLVISVYIVIGNLILRPTYSVRLKSVLFAILNLVAVYAYFFQVVMFATYPQAFLCVSNALVLRVSIAEEIIFKLHHS